MVDRIEFNRGATGVGVGTDWEDADIFAKIGSFMSPMPSDDEVVVALPSGSDVGTLSLKSALNEYRPIIRRAVLKCSDTYTILDSG